ncbi:acyltransferase [Phenylobacterium sp. LjRoot219]|uniref:acyltransferase family protein n=1 Tax=Phenylobacterium sp. LjRoot219 TaxID=3342283 RepID=UPI003ED0FC7B
MTQTTPKPYWDRLDHLRGVAAFMVFAWHFTHARGVVPAVEPSLLSIFEEGHTGVSLFMVLSGYLFAKIVGERRIDIVRFVQARAMRLGPMLAVGLAFAYAAHPARWSEIPLGLVWPVWDNGCWSVAVELQFYLLLPALLFAFRRAPAAALGIVVLAAAARWALFEGGADLQFFAYYSLLGRIDQFVLGIFAWKLLQGRPVPLPVFALGFGGFLVALHGFNLAGGHVGTAASPLWIWWPTVEALGFALLIAWYDGGRWSLPRPFAFIGKVSFSMYILHFVVVTHLADLALRLLPEPGFYGMFLASIAAFALMLPVAWLGWRLVETPAMRLRRPYLLAAEPAPVGEPVKQAA